MSPQDSTSKSNNSQQEASTAFPPNNVENNDQDQPTNQSLPGGSGSGSGGSYKFEEKFGDLFSSDDSICHCVSECLSMSKGIAVAFKEKYGRVDELKRQRAKTGGLAVLHIPEEGKYIYYLVTKEKYYLKPTYETLTSSLAAMKKHAQEHSVKRISLPLIGCGLDRLVWSRVREILDQIFGDMDMTLTLYKIENNNNTNSSRGRGGAGGGNKRGGRGGGSRGGSQKRSGNHQNSGNKRVK